MNKLEVVIINGHGRIFTLLNENKEHKKSIEVQLEAVIFLKAHYDTAIVPDEKVHTKGSMPRAPASNERSENIIPSANVTIVGSKESLDIEVENNFAEFLLLSLSEKVREKDSKMAMEIVNSMEKPTAISTGIDQVRARI